MDRAPAKPFSCPSSCRTNARRNITAAAPSAPRMAGMRVSLRKPWLARPSQRVGVGPCRRHVFNMTANLATGKERREKRSRPTVDRLDTACRQMRPAHHAEGVSSTHAGGVAPPRRVARPRPPAACWKHAFIKTRVSTVCASYAFRRAPCGSARARAMTIPEPLRRSG